MQELSKISEAALPLSLDERTILANQLAESLHSEMDADTDKAWRAEIRRRVEQIRTGAVELIDSEHVFSETRRST